MRRMIRRIEVEAVDLTLCSSTWLLSQETASLSTQFEKEI